MLTKYPDSRVLYCIRMSERCHVCTLFLSSVDIFLHFDQDHVLNFSDNSTACIFLSSAAVFKSSQNLIKSIQFSSD